MKRLALILFALILTSASVGAQSTTSEVNGTIKDESGAVVPGVEVKLTDAATGRELTTTASDEGFYSFANVRPGTYTLVAERTGFKREQVQDVKIDVGVPTTVNFSLQTGGVDETITVSSSDAQSVINTTNAELSTTVQQRQINDLPLNGRNPLDLAGLQAGVSAGSTNRSATINGLRGTFSNITWDGININDNYIRDDSLFGDAAPSVPGVAEFTLTTQNSGPGDGVGVAQVKLVTPRGTSEFHGQLCEYHRNDVLDANTFFNNADGLPKPKLIRNQFGGALGGPFVVPRVGEGGPLTYGKNKLFFYAHYEGTLERTDIELDRTVLTQSARQGLFTYRRQDNGQLQTVNLLNLTGGTVDPLTQSLVALTPLPNNLTGGDTRNFADFNFNTPAGTDSHAWGFRLDYDHSERHRFEVIYSQFRFKLPNDPFNDIGEPFPGLPGGGQQSVRPRLSSAWNWTPTPTFNNELRAGFAQNAPRFNIPRINRNFQVTFPLIGDPEQNNLPQGRDTATYDVINNASKSVGNHFIRFGGNFRLVFIEPFDEGLTVPRYTVGFNGINTIDPLEDVTFPGGIAATDLENASSILSILTGSIASYAQTFNAADRTSGFVPGQGSRSSYKYFNIGSYVGDTWRVRPNLTLNLGLRHEFISVPVERNGLALLPRGGIESLLDPNAVVDFASGGGRPLFNNDWNNFAPNVSFAWDPFGTGKTSIRGGYGISYVIDNNITTVANAAVVGNDGLTTAVTVNDATGTLSGGGVQPVPVPTFQIPRTARLSFEESFNSALFTIDPNLRTPYVQQWNLGIERELFRDTVFEIRYVGNRGIKLTRAIDLNQQNIFAGGFLDDFRRAQFNLANCGNRVNPTAAQCANRQPLQVLPRFGPFAFFDLSSVRTGQPSALLDFYIQNKEFFFPDYGGPGTIPLSTFLPNPNTYAADLVSNGSFSNYNALQTEIRRRFQGGLDFQANYTFSKALTDFEGTTSNFEAYQDLTLGSILEKRRSRNDLTHVFKANAGYELPFGLGKRFFSDGAMSRILGGFKVTGIATVASGRPVSIISARQTLNRGTRANRNTVDTTLTLDELRERTGLFFDPDTGRPLLFDPSLIAADGRANSQFFSNPQPGRPGSLQLTPVSGPGYWNIDLGIIKRTPITENVNIEFRAEAFNAFNHTNFFLPIDTTTELVRQNINNTAFGQITETFDPRIIQFAIKLNF
ncbi:MAG TPA: TonB-dependent receptor [Pyrinomonadaceae bacterium]|nr:TonB-dependent receptor [Pyrinomonadaceae bacterium]